VQVSKYAKRSNRNNPRQDRNSGYEPKFSPSNPRNAQKDSNLIELNFPFKPKKKKIDIIPRNLNQEDLVAALEDNTKHIVFAVGPAGCGKTLLATLHAIKCLKEGLVEKIVITRPNVAVDDKDIGFLPGDITKKLSPWCMPVLDILGEYYSQKEIAMMLEEGIIEMIPLAYMRGRTLKNAYIIFDEAQNSTPTSMLSVLTRIGEGSRMIVTGDVKQGDRGYSNGLSDFISRFANGSTHIELIQFTPKDVERHPVIREVLELYKDIS
jgi:phosphate starvation-inducible PhoH-like protein